MRTLSKSVFVDKDEELIVIDSSDGNVEENQIWDESNRSSSSKKANRSKSNYYELYATLKENDNRTCSTALQMIDRETIKIRDYSADEVKRVGESLISKPRKHRTLEESQSDVPDTTNMLMGMEKPTPPPTAYDLYEQKKYPDLRKESPTAIAEKLKAITQEFEKLSDKKRRKYERKAALKESEYQENLKQYYEAKAEKISKKKRRKKEHLLQSKLSDEAATAENVLRKKRHVKLPKKPESIALNAYQYYLSIHRPKYVANGITGYDKEIAILANYKKLNDQERLDLQENYNIAKEQFKADYLEYIDGIPKEQQPAEINHLNELIMKLSKTNKKTKRKDKPKRIEITDSETVSLSFNLKEKSNLVDPISLDFQINVNVRNKLISTESIMLRESQTKVIREAQGDIEKISERCDPHEENEEGPLTTVVKTVSQTVEQEIDNTTIAQNPPSEKEGQQSTVRMEVSNKETVVQNESQPERMPEPKSESIQHLNCTIGRPIPTRYHGKPEYVDRNVFNYYKRGRDNWLYYTFGVTKMEQENIIRNDFNHLNTQEMRNLKDEHEKYLKMLESDNFERRKSAPLQNTGWTRKPWDGTSSLARRARRMSQR